MVPLQSRKLAESDEYREVVDRLIVMVDANVHASNERRRMFYALDACTVASCWETLTQSQINNRGKKVVGGQEGGSLCCNWQSYTTSQFMRLTRVLIKKWVILFILVVQEPELCPRENNPILLTFQELGVALELFRLKTTLAYIIHITAKRIVYISIS